MKTGLVMLSCDLSLITLGQFGSWNVILFRSLPMLAVEIAARNEPAPPSFVLVTTVEGLSTYGDSTAPRSGSLPTGRGSEAMSIVGQSNGPLGPSSTAEFIEDEV